MTETEERLRAAGFGPGSGLSGPGGSGSASVVTAGPNLRAPTPGQYEPICDDCDEYGGSGMYAACDLLEQRLEAQAGGRGCCRGRLVAETARVQRQGGCPDGRF